MMKTVKRPFKTAVFAPEILYPHIDELVGWYMSVKVIGSRLMDVVVRTIIEHDDSSQLLQLFNENQPLNRIFKACIDGSGPKRATFQKHRDPQRKRWKKNHALTAEKKDEFSESLEAYKVRCAKSHTATDQKHRMSATLDNIIQEAWDTLTFPPTFKFPPAIYGSGAMVAEISKTYKINMGVHLKLHLIPNVLKAFKKFARTTDEFKQNASKDSERVVGYMGRKLESDISDGKYSYRPQPTTVTHANGFPELLSKCEEARAMFRVPFLAARKSGKSVTGMLVLLPLLERASGIVMKPVPLFGMTSLSIPLNSTTFSALLHRIPPNVAIQIIAKAPISDARTKATAMIQQFTNEDGSWKNLAGPFARIGGNRVVMQQFFKTKSAGSKWYFQFSIKTDGVSVSNTYGREPYSTKNGGGGKSQTQLQSKPNSKKKKSSTNINVNYEEMYKLDASRISWIGVDPGHASIIFATNLRTGEQLNITNGYYRQLTRSTTIADKREHLMSVTLDANSVWELLSQPSSNLVLDPNQWTPLWTNWTRLVEIALDVRFRKMKLDAYISEQKGLYQISEKLLHMVVPGDLPTLFWGNGCQSPTSRGHTSAPNKKLRDFLTNRGFTIALTAEYNTSQICPGKPTVSSPNPCGERLVSARYIDEVTGQSRQIRGLKHCTKTGHTINRDLVGAMNIAMMGKYQLEHYPSSDLHPAYAAKNAPAKKKRKRITKNTTKKKRKTNE
jgi:hypothetical protein